MKNDSNYKSTKKKSKKISYSLRLLRWFRTVMALSTHIYSNSFSLSLYSSRIFISDLCNPFTLVFQTRLMSAHLRWDWVKTAAHGDSSGSMRSNNAAAENIQSLRRLPAIDVTQKTVCRESR